jgi:N-acetylglucosamine-6-phosphate deacetylase
VRGRAFVDGEVRGVAIEVDGDRITAVTPEGMAPSSPPDGTILPGAVDLHCHGGGGTTFIDLDADDAAAAARHQHRRGTTTLLASLVSLAPEDLARGVEILADLADDGLVDGIHLEGPWISAARCGAHDPALLRDPDRVEVDRLLALGRGHVRQVTLAPERPG